MSEILKVKNPGRSDWIVKRTELNLPSLVIPAGQVRETPPCRNLQEILQSGRLQLVAKSTAEILSVENISVPEELKPVFPNAPKQCKATAASTGKRCANSVLENSDYCRMHAKRFDAAK